MKKKFVPVFFAVMLAGISAHAQQAEKFNPATDKQQVNGYTIQLLPMPGNTFGFSIVKDRKPMYVQLTDPFSHSPVGFKTKQDAYSVGTWVVNEGSKNGRMPVSIPQTVAKQLNLQ